MKTQVASTIIEPPGGFSQFWTNRPSVTAMHAFTPLRIQNGSSGGEGGETASRDGCKGICRKRVEQRIELAKLLSNLVNGQGVSGKLKHLLDGNGIRNISLAKSVELFSTLCATRVHLRKRGGSARGVRIGIGEYTQTIGCCVMCRFELCAKVPAEGGFLWQSLNKRLDRGGDSVEAGDDFRERGKSRAKIFALHRSEVQQVLQSRNDSGEAPIVQVGAFS